MSGRVTRSETAPARRKNAIRIVSSSSEDEEQRVEEEKEKEEEEPNRLGRAYLRNNDILPTRYPGSSFFKEVGWTDDITYLFRNVGWLHFMTHPQYTYSDITREFLRSLAVEYPLPRGYHVPMFSTITFRLRGTQYSLSRDAFNEIFHFNPATTQDYPNTFNIQEFWGLLTGEPHYDPRHAKATLIRNPILRYAHKTMVYTIFGRGDSGNNVRKDELAYLFCMLNSHQMNTGGHIVDQMRRVAKSRRGGDIVIGGIITSIALHLGVPINEQRRVEGSRLINLDSVTSFKFIAVSPLGGYTYQLYNDPRQSFHLPNPLITVRNNDGVRFVLREGLQPIVPKGIGQVPNIQIQQQQHAPPSPRQPELHQPRSVSMDPDHGLHAPPAQPYSPIGDVHNFWGTLPARLGNLETCLKEVRESQVRMEESQARMEESQVRMEHFMRTGQWPLRKYRRREAHQETTSEAQCSRGHTDTHTVCVEQEHPSACVTSGEVAQPSAQGDTGEMVDRLT